MPVHARRRYAGDGPADDHCIANIRNLIGQSGDTRHDLLRNDGENARRHVVPAQTAKERRQIGRGKPAGDSDIVHVTRSQRRDAIGHNRQGPGDCRRATDDDRVITASLAAIQTDDRRGSGKQSQVVADIERAHDRTGTGR